MLMLWSTQYNYSPGGARHKVTRSILVIAELAVIPLSPLHLFNRWVLFVTQNDVNMSDYVDTTLCPFTS